MKWLLFYQLSFQYPPPCIARDESNCPHFHRAETEEVHFNGEWAKTLRANLELLGCSDDLYADGTFNICPRMFYQILTIHAFKYGKQFPLAYFLLPGKSREVYNTASPNVCVDIVAFLIGEMAA